MTPKLSVVCLAYNHAPFIRQALDSMMMQKTSFPFEVIIHDDASADGTADIIKEYAEKYPEVIKPICQTENQWGKKNIWREIVFPLIRGQYVIYCEGDDYFTDENKFQKQADFLDSHPDFSVCFHPVLVKWEDKSQPDTIFPSKKNRRNKTVLTFKDLIKENFMQTNSVMYRWRFHTAPLNLIPDSILPGDWFLHLLHAQIGKIGFLPDVMAVYRKQRGGIWYGAGKQAEWYLNMFFPRINFYEAVKKQFGINMLDLFYSIVFSTYYAAIFLHRDDMIGTLQNKYDFLKFPAKKQSNIEKKKRLLKLVYKLLPNPYRIKYKRHYNSLKLYLEWKKS